MSWQPELPTPDDRPRGPRFQLRLRSASMAIGLIAAAPALARHSFLFRVVLAFLGAFAAGLGMLGLGMAANLVGFGIFGLFDRMLGVRRPGGKPKRGTGDGWDDFRPI